jgi:HJR/Mrr/RecB family endonuclease
VKLIGVMAVSGNHVQCTLCSNLIRPGEMFWRIRENSADNPDRLLVCRAHIPLNTARMTVQRPDNGAGVTYLHSDHVDVRAAIVPRLKAEPEAIHCLTPDEFEELVLDRLMEMGMQGFRLGPANRRDGGVDIVFWSTGALPILGAVQVKHHRVRSRGVSPDVVRELSGAMGRKRFNVGIIATNTFFTYEAKIAAQNSDHPILLRDGEILAKWVVSDYEPEALDFVVRNQEFCTGVVIGLPEFF